ncbi:MAG TPA: S-methyl-5'-thioadenosine phosphorylase [Candidatus Methylacidiphilales bacterium]|jgi:5'-methylthioadenosine phosphorylase|nr:S-methyl-5'-thioadenosine phosphorylase [Candidatus Methylacidiphilales bacterium]
MSLPPPIGIIGGSGLYQLAAFTGQKELRLDTPFGPPSDAYIRGQLAGHDVAFLPRHGRGHRLLPSEIPHRANIHGFRQLGARWIISISAVGSLQHDYAPGDVVLPDQFFDRTKGRAADTFFGEGIVAHVAFGDPVSPELQDVLHASAQAAGATVHKGGTYVNIEGPQFSTRAESETYRSSGHAIVGMTNLVEAKLAREAQIAYATVAMVTDYDCWHPDHDSVTVEMVVQWLHKNTATAQAILLEAVPRVAKLTHAKAHEALKYAILTQKEHWPEATAKKLAVILEGQPPA